MTDAARGTDFARNLIFTSLLLPSLVALFLRFRIFRAPSFLEILLQL